MIIGITGRSGSGKSYLSDELAQNINAIHVKIDEISHSVLNLEKTHEFLKAEFGNIVFDKNTIDRKTLGKIVFNDKEKLSKLNAFCQTEMEKIINKIIKESTTHLILDYALLPWLSQFQLCDLKILINSSFEDRFERVSSRENISTEYFKNRDNSVGDYNNFEFDLVLDNPKNANIKELINKIIEFGGINA